MKQVLSASNSLGYARAEAWSPGLDAYESHSPMASDVSFRNRTNSGHPNAIKEVSGTTCKESFPWERISVGKDGVVALPQAFRRRGQFCAFALVNLVQPVF